LKLLTRSTYYFFVFSILAMIAAGFIFYFSIRAIVYNQIDDSLITEKTIIQDQIEETDLIPDFTSSFGHLIEVRLLDSPTISSQTIKDTILYVAKSETYMPFRHLKFSANTPGKTGYTINIYQVVDENQELLDNIGMGMFILTLSLLLVSILTNYLVSKQILSPFFNAVNEAAKFDVLSDKKVKLPDTNISEFRQLNMVIENMTSKMRADYLNLKEYNENSSHEIQTPLAVIRSKLDMLMQNKTLNKESINHIKSINEAVNRLFKLNQGLLLISRIENLQFHETKKLSLKKYIENCLENYEEILQLKKIKVEFDFSDEGDVIMNELLADVLISNLLSNAVRYNKDGGFIICCIDSLNLSISNSGEQLDFDPLLLFNRFVKAGNNPQSVGLGLSIVKKIADHYKMPITYTCKGSVHEIKIEYRGATFNEDNPTHHS
jgi:signal transduction histidine kinase